MNNKKFDWKTNSLFGILITVIGLVIIGISVSAYFVNQQTQKDLNDTTKNKTVVETMVNTEDYIYNERDKKINIRPYCRFGLQFIITDTHYNGKFNLNTTQVFNVDPKTGLSVPMKCADIALTKP